MVSAKSFYGSSKELYNIILVSGDKNKNENVRGNSIKEVLIWFGTGHGFVRILLEETESGTRDTHK